MHVKLWRFYLVALFELAWSIRRALSYNLLSFCVDNLIRCMLNLFYECAVPCFMLLVHNLNLLDKGLISLFRVKIVRPLGLLRLVFKLVHR